MIRGLASQAAWGLALGGIYVATWALPWVPGETARQYLDLLEKLNADG